MDFYFFKKIIRENMSRFCIYLLYTFKITELLRTIKKGKVLILMYHGISNKQFFGLENYDGKNVDVKKFNWQLRYIKNRYSVISLKEYVQKIKNNEKIPKRSIILTFDDGYENFYENAYPLLKKHKFKATVFPVATFIDSIKISWFDQVEHAVNTTKEKEINLETKGIFIKYHLYTRNQKVMAITEIKNLISVLEKNKRELVLKLLRRILKSEMPYPENYYFLKWDQLKNMIRYNIDIEYHSAHHDVLTTLSDQELKEDITFCKKLFKANLDVTISLFAYPQGVFNERTKEIVQQNGFICALTTVEGSNKNPDLFELKRIAIHNFLSNAEFVWKLVTPFS